MIDLGPFQSVELCGGFILQEVQLTAKPLLDPLERAASALTIIRGRRFHIFLRADMNEQEISISLYHEVLEAATLATDSPPAEVMDLNEAGFEQAARAANEKLGIASPQRLNQLLEQFGFK